VLVHWNYLYEYPENGTDETNDKHGHGTSDHVLGDFRTVLAKDRLAGRTVVGEGIGTVEAQRPDTDHKAATQPTSGGETLVYHGHNLFVTVTADSRHWFRPKHSLHLYYSGASLCPRLRPPLSSSWS